MPVPPRPETVPRLRRGRTSLNLASNVGGFVVSTLIGVWFPPYLIHNLGVAGYGLVPLATTVTSYMALLTVALNGAVGRYLIIGMERNDYDEANRVFNTSLFGSLALILVLAAPAWWFSSNAASFFNVPAGYEEQFVWLFYCTIAAFFLTMVSSTFSLSSYSRNRFDIRNAVSVTGNLTRVLAVVLLFTLLQPGVWQVGVGIVVSAAIVLTGALISWRLLTPMLRVQPRYFGCNTLRSLTGTGGWIVVNQIGTLLFLSIDLIVVNKVIGPLAAGQYAAVMTWSILLRQFSSVIGGVFGPTVMAKYARADMPGVIEYVQRAVKFVGLLIALPIGLVCGLSVPLLKVWLGTEFLSFAPLMTLMTIHLSVNLGIQPLFNAQVAANKVRLPGIVTCFAGFLNLGLALVLAGPVGWGMYGVAAASALTLSAKNLIFTPLYVAHILGVKWHVLYNEKMPVAAATMCLAGVGWLVSHFLPLDNWGALIGAAIVLSGAFVIAGYRLLLTPPERAMALRFLHIRTGA